MGWGGIAILGRPLADLFRSISFAKPAGLPCAKSPQTRPCRPLSVFRDSLFRYFTGPKRVARKSFSIWLLELVFSDRSVAQKEVICCDACQHRLVGRQGRLAFGKRAPDS